MSSTPEACGACPACQASALNLLYEILAIRKLPTRGLRNARRELYNTGPHVTCVTGKRLDNMHTLEV